MALRDRILQSHLPEELPRPRVKLFIANLRVGWLFSTRLGHEGRQFADVVRIFSLLLANGLPVGVAIQWLAPRLSGYWQQIFAELAIRLDHGADLVTELEQLAQSIQLPAVAEFTQKLTISIERGTPAAAMVMQLAASMQQQQLRELIQKAGRNETKMLIPTIFLILPITVLFAIFPSLLVLQAAYQ